MAIVTVASWKSFKGISATTYDAQLAVLVPQAIDDFQTYTGRVLDQATFTEKHDGNEQRSITLFNAPLVSITSVTLTVPSGATSVIPLTAFAYDVDSGVLKFDPPGNFNGWVGYFPGEQNSAVQGAWQEYPVFPRGHQNITVAYVGGYSGTYPAGMQGAIHQYIDVLIGQALLAPGQMAYKSERSDLYAYERGTPTDDPLVRLFYRFKRLGGGQ